MDVKKSLYTIFEEPTKHKFGITVQALIFSNIIISIIVMFLETEKDFSTYFPIFAIINKINVALFTLEYVLRLYSITHQTNKRRIKYALSPYMLIDLIAILPFYLSLFNMDFGFLRALRIIRIFKLFRLTKFAQFDNLISEIIKEKKEEFIFIFVALMILVLTITPLVYFAEKDAQPEVFSSMGTTMWWAIITFTTVGYGDMFPITTIGRILTSFVSFLGIAFYAIPGSIFTSALLEKINEKKRLKNNEKKL
ncbi:MAG: ion transporter [Campylobacteraceae bacterium]|nr:ion transporter [Campylobacteraceae bacterium]